MRFISKGIWTLHRYLPTSHYGSIEECIMDWVVTYLVTLNHSILDKVLIWWMKGGRVINIRGSMEYFTAATQHHNNVILGEDQWSPVVFIPWQCHPGWIGYVIRCVGWAQVNATHKLTPLKALCVLCCVEAQKSWATTSTERRRRHVLGALQYYADNDGY